MKKNYKTAHRVELRKKYIQTHLSFILSLISIAVLPIYIYHQSCFYLLPVYHLCISCKAMPDIKVLSLVISKLLFSVNILYIVLHYIFFS